VRYPAENGDHNDSPAAPSDAVTVKVVEIIDGDTLRTDDLDGDVLTIRIFGIDASERGETFYGEANNRLRKLAGVEVRLVAAGRLHDLNGRELSYVYTEVGIRLAPSCSTKSSLSPGPWMVRFVMS
jgi:endonuclease YncB( thermonuclease family)